MQLLELPKRKMTHVIRRRRHASGNDATAAVYIQESIVRSKDHRNVSTRSQHTLLSCRLLSSFRFF